jgi:site-specific DNA-methyltransferase (adenine-specific)
MIEINKNYNESNLKTMAKMSDCFIDLTVTSPPYDDLRTYNGYSFPFEDIAKELYRVTKQGGVVVWIVGDGTKNGSESGTSFRQALYFKDIGFNLHDTMIYHRQGSFPMDKHHRYWQDFEYVFILSKGKPKTFNPIKEDSVRKAGSKIHRRRLVENVKGSTLVDRTAYGNKSLGNVWYIPAGNNVSTKDKIAFSHPAIFPEKLAYYHIKTWTNENDLVYDCFMGSGTTAKASILANRNYIGSEISKEYCDIIEKRLQPLRHNLFT